MGIVIGTGVYHTYPVRYLVLRPFSFTRIQLLLLIETHLKINEFDYQQNSGIDTAIRHKLVLTSD